MHTIEYIRLNKLKKFYYFLKLRNFFYCLNKANFFFCLSKMDKILEKLEKLKNNASPSRGKVQKEKKSAPGDYVVLPNKKKKKLLLNLFFLKVIDIV